MACSKHCTVHNAPETKLLSFYSYHLYICIEVFRRCLQVFHFIVKFSQPSFCLNKIISGGNLMPVSMFLFFLQWSFRSQKHFFHQWWRKTMATSSQWHQCVAMEWFLISFLIGKPCQKYYVFLYLFGFVRLQKQK